LPPIKLAQPVANDTAAPTHASLAMIDPTCAKATPNALDLFLDAGSLAAEIAQVIELGPADIATSFHLDFSDGGAVRLKYALDAFTVRNLSDRKRRVEPPVPFRNHDTFIGLKPLAIAFRHAHLDYDGVTRRKVGNVLFQLLLF
jgi:hypothetical protein